VATIFVDFVAGLVEDAPLGAAATTLNSAGLANLPEVTSGDIVKVCLNPGAVGDPPEIAYITAHVAAAEDATLLRGQEGTTGTEWAATTVWTTVITADDMDDLRTSGGVSAGDIKSGVWSAAPTGWLLLDGTAHADADTDYPDLWAAAPAAWKSGSTLTLPDMTEDRVLLGGGTVGTEAGANTHTLITANLPPHEHTITHTHAIDHNHAAFTSGSDGANTSANFTAQTLSAGGSWVARRESDSGTDDVINTNSPDHTHSIDVPAYTGTSGASSATNTGSVGSSTAVDHTPAHLRVNWAIKT